MKTHNKILAIIVLTFLITLSQTQPTFSDNCFNYNTNLSVCQQCNPGFFLQYFFCVTCNPNCACSSQHDYCDYCLPLQYNGLNYLSYHHPELDQCLLCNNSIPYCLECTNLQFCTKCFNGQYLIEQKSSNGAIVGMVCSSNVCQANCQYCLNQIKCQQCQPGFYLYPNKTCSQNPCTSNCTTCSSLTDCQVCVEGYFVSNGQCIECTANCVKCTNGTGCEVCAASFALESGVCTNTSLANCIEYANGNTVCTGCSTGNQVTAGSCNSCTGCELCTQQFICLTPCLPGYQQFNFACIPSFQTKVTFTTILLIILLLFVS